MHGDKDLYHVCSWLAGMCAWMDVSPVHKVPAVTSLFDSLPQSSLPLFSQEQAKPSFTQSLCTSYFLLLSLSPSFILLVLLCLSLTLSSSERPSHVFCILQPVYFIHGSNSTRELQSLGVKPQKKVNVLCLASPHEHRHYPVPFYTCLTSVNSSLSQFRTYGNFLNRRHE